jgi:hypothetical protein
VFLVLVQMLNSLMMFHMTARSMLTIVVVMVNVATSFVLFQVMDHVLVLMAMRGFTVVVDRSVIVFHD